MPDENELTHIDNTLKLAHYAMARGDWKKVRKSTSVVLMRDPNNAEAKALFYYAVHHPDPKCRPSLDELKEAGISEEFHEQAPVDPSQPTSCSMNDGYVPNFGPWDDRMQAWMQGVYQWDVLISYRNVAADTKKARSTANFLSQTGFLSDGTIKSCRVFFAPFSLGVQFLRMETAWVYEIERALMSSCHFIGYLSKDYIESPYCELEFEVFRRITEQNPARTLSYVVPEHEKASAMNIYGPDKGKFIRTSGEVLDAITETFGAILGKPYGPRVVLQPLPLHSLDSNLHVWSDNTLDLLSPPYDAYESIVRDKMIRIMKGLDPSTLPVGYIGNPLWNEKQSAAAEKSARVLLAMGVSPLK